MAALKINRNIISVEYQFIHSKFRAVSILPELPSNEDDKERKIHDTLLSAILLTL